MVGQFERARPEELNRLRKKGHSGVEFELDSGRGLKPDVDVIAFIGLAKAMPLLQSPLFDAPKEFFRKL